jgi:Putative bacterial sensory transduction regulator
VTPAEVVESYLHEQRISFQRAADSFAFSVSGEHKKSMPVVLTLRERTLGLEAFFMRRPMDDPAEVYRILLSRNMRSSPVRFAADAGGDVYIVGEVPAARVDHDALDELLGAALSTADEMFPYALEIGFASYLEADRAYRAAHPPDESAS